MDKALAIGSLEPLNEIAVKSKISGVVGKLFVDVGDFVRQGEPLLEVKPDPTPIELAEAKRNVEMVTIELKTIQRELERNEQLKTKGLISDQDFENLRRSFEEAELRHKIADMKDIIFKGTVDEIDVGKIKEGQKTELVVGALPGKTVKGHVGLISLKAKKVENTTVFPIEIVIDDAGDAHVGRGQNDSSAKQGFSGHQYFSRRDWCH